MEADDEEANLKEMLAVHGGAMEAVPPQLLFSHQGQKEIDGFNVFKTISF